MGEPEKDVHFCGQIDEEFETRMNNYNKATNKYRPKFKDII